MDINAIKSKLDSLKSSTVKAEKIDYSKYLWKPKEEGKYIIRFVPSLLNPENPFQEIYVHYGIGKYPIFSLINWGEKDPIVEFAKQLKATNEKENWILSKKLEPKMRVYAPIVVRGEEEKGVRLWEFGKEIYMSLLGIAEDEDYGDYTDVAEGRDFTVDVVRGDVGGRQGLKSTLRIKPKTTPLGSSKAEVKGYLENQPSLLDIQRKLSFDDLKEILQNFLSVAEGVEDEEGEGEVEVKPKETKGTGKYSMDTSKISPSKKFDALFSDEDEENE